MNTINHRASAASQHRATRSCGPEPASGLGHSAGIADAPLPRVTTKVRKPDFSLWPPDVAAEMRAIWDGRKE